MKIIGAETYLLKVPLQQPAITDAQTRLEAVEMIALRLDTDAGIAGWGFNWNYTQGTRAVQVILEDNYLPPLIGQDPQQRKTLIHQLPYATHFLGRLGVTRVALCTVELALWDLQVKRVNLPLWQYLGPVQDRVKAYNTDGGWLGATTEELIRDMATLVDRGFDAVKMKIGRPDPREDYARVQAVRQALPDSVRLMVDANTVWDQKTAKVWGRRLQDLRIAWLEEPLAPEDIGGHADLAQALDLPIAVGETLYTRDTFRDYMAQGAVDIVQADATKLAGIDEWLDVAALARCYHLEVIPHTNVQQKLHVQLAAATPNVPMVEYCYESLAEIWEEPIAVVDGYYSLPQAPGVGLKLADRVLTECRVG